MLDKFIAGFVHEIRNPLSTIKMNLQILEHSQNLQGSDLECLGMALEEVSRLDQILQEVLKFAKGSKITLEPSNLNEIVKNSILVVEEEAEKKKVLLTTQLAERIPEMLLDPKNLQTALVNILTNSLQALSNNGFLFLTTKAILNDNNFTGAQITITDNGHGIPEEEQSKIFGPFYSTRNHKLGLGLTIVKNILEQHQAELVVKSQVNQGTTLEIFLPKNPEQ